MGMETETLILYDFKIQNNWIHHAPKVSGLVDSKFVFGTKLNKKAYLVEGLPHVTRTLMKWCLVMLLSQTIQDWWIITKNNRDDSFWLGHLTIPKPFFNRNFSPWCQRITSKGHWVTTSTLAIQNEGDRSRSMTRSKENFDAILRVEPKKKSKVSLNHRCNWLWLLFSRKLYTGF